MTHFHVSCCFLVETSQNILRCMLSLLSKVDMIIVTLLTSTETSHRIQKVATAALHTPPVDVIMTVP